MNLRRHEFCFHHRSSNGVKSRKYRRKTEEKKMRDLPDNIIETIPFFIYIGIDCFGPI